MLTNFNIRRLYLLNLPPRNIRTLQDTLQKSTAYEENIIFRTRIQIDSQTSFMANNFKRY